MRPAACVVHEFGGSVVPQTVAAAAVRAAPEDGGDVCNSCNLHEWAPFRADCDGVRVDPSWWASLAPEHRALMSGAVVVTVSEAPIDVPHAAEIRTHAGCGALYNAYNAGFAFHHWRHMQPAAHLVALAPSDRDVLESVAIRHAVYNGRKLNEEDLEGLPALISALTEAIRAVGGQAFVKTAEKSAKNDVPLRPHATAQSALTELTSSEDVLRQSLSGGAAGRARYLVVQPWEHGISAHNEWRLIVCGGRVAGISQQTWRRAAGHTEASARAAVPSLIRLWQELAPLSPYADCVVDAHVDSSSGRAKLIEVNACGWWGPSGSALFHYQRDHELLRDPDRLPVRVVVETADEYTVSLHR
jgi:hypothetical protein